MISPRSILTLAAAAAAMATDGAAPRAEPAPAAAASAGAGAPPDHITTMTAFGYNASAQAGWSSWGKSFNLSALVEGYERYKLPGLYRIDCVGCQTEETGGGKYPPNPGFAAGVVCDHRNCSTCVNVYHMCEKARGDATDWDAQTLKLLGLARPHLVSGALRGIYLGDELSASGRGAAPNDPTALSFNDIERWVDLVRGFLDSVAPARLAAGTKDDLILYYTSSDWMATWPHIPRNLSLFSMDDYHPAWMYPSSPVEKCRVGGFPRPAGCENETTGLWAYPVYQNAVFPKLGPDTKLLVVPPVYGSHNPCTSGPPSSFCTNQTYDQWLELVNGNLTFYRDWAYSDSRIIGFDPWPLTAGGPNTSSFALGLLDMPEILKEYQALGKSILAGARDDDSDFKGAGDSPLKNRRFAANSSSMGNTAAAAPTAAQTTAALAAVARAAPAPAVLAAPAPAPIRTDDEVVDYTDPRTRQGIVTPAGNNSITYFSWYAYGEDLPGKAYTNLAMHGNLTFLRRRYEEQGTPGMLFLVHSKWGVDGLQKRGAPWIHVSNPVFGYGPEFPGPGFVGLSKTWEAAVDDCIATITPLAKGNGGHIHGIQIGDELVCAGFPLSNLTALSARLHDGLHRHGVFIFTNECFNQGAACKNDSDCAPPTRGGSSGGGHPVCMQEGPGVVFPGCQAAVWPEVPAGLDHISLDIYFPFPDGNPLHGGWTEVEWAKAFYNKYFLPLLKPHQTVWLVPGLFGSNSSSGGGFGPEPTPIVYNATAMQATDDELVLKLTDYWACYSVASMRWGVEPYNETLEWIKAKVAQLPSASTLDDSDFKGARDSPLKSSQLPQQVQARADTQTQTQTQTQMDVATAKLTWESTATTQTLKSDDSAAWSDVPPAVPGMQLWKQRVRQGHHGYRDDSLGDADFFLALLIGVPGPRPALLAFTEVRKFTDMDWGAKGIGMRASYDGGRTFTTSVEIVTDPPQAANLTREWTAQPYRGEGWDGLSLGTVTYDNHTGEILVHYTLCANPCIQFGCVRPKSCGPDYTSRTMIVSSNDSFQSWSAPVEVSAQLASGKKPIYTFFPGSGEGTQTASGRLIVCGYTNDCAPARGQKRNCTDPRHCVDNCQSSVLILSDTHGKTWRGGARVTDYSALPTNECDAVVLRNGSVLVSMRSYGQSRMQARSDDGGESFVASSIHHVPELPSPGCQSSLIADADGTLFLSHPYNPSTRENMTISTSTDDGNSWSVLANVWSGPSGYGSLAVVPTVFGGPPSVALAYNRGQTGDGCYGSACPYSTVVSFVVVPTSQVSAEAKPAPDGIKALPSPVVEDKSEGEPPLMSVGWWCSSSSWPADSPGIFDNHERIVADVAARSCTSNSDCVAANNVSDLLFGPRRCLNGTDTLCPYVLANGTALPLVSDLVQFGRDRWGSNKFIIAEKLGSAWSALIADAACYAKEQLNRSGTNRCGEVMKSYSDSLCQALRQAALTEWILDGESVYAKEGVLLDEHTGPGTAQALRYIKSTCAIEYNLALTIGWTLHGDSGMQTYLFQNYTTFVGSRAMSRVVDLADWLLPRTYGDPLRGKYFSFSASAHPGECSPSRDQAIMEWTTNAREQYQIPASKLLIGVGSTHTSYRCDASPMKVAPCDTVPTDCVASDWTPSRGDRAGSSSQEEIYDQVAAGTMTMRFDVWAQQSYFASNQTGEEGLTYVDSNTARAFDFQLRQLKWRGVRGYFTQCVEDDYTVTSLGVGRHWAQDSAVHQRFQQESELFAVSVGATSSVVGGLDISSGDSICRMFGGRIETLEEPVVPARCAVPPCVVNCFGIRPATAASAWPFTLLRFNGSHRSQLGFNSSRHKDLPTRDGGSGTSIAAPMLLQITTKSMARLDEKLDPTKLATDVSYRREEPFTSDAGRIIAALLGGVVATEAQVHAAAASGADWPQLGLTMNDESPRENDMRGLAPAGAMGVVRNVLQVFDGGLRALGAVNVYTNISATVLERVNGDPTSPFYVRHSHTYPL